LNKVIFIEMNYFCDVVRIVFSGDNQRVKIKMFKFCMFFAIRAKFSLIDNDSFAPGTNLKIQNGNFFQTLGAKPKTILATREARDGEEDVEDKVFYFLVKTQ